MLRTFGSPRVFERSRTTSSWLMTDSYHRVVDIQRNLIHPTPPHDGTQTVRRLMAHGPARDASSLAAGGDSGVSAPPEGQIATQRWVNDKDSVTTPEASP